MSYQGTLSSQFILRFSPSFHLITSSSLPHHLFVTSLSFKVSLCSPSTLPLPATHPLLINLLFTVFTPSSQPEPANHQPPFAFTQRPRRLETNHLHSRHHNPPIHLAHRFHHRMRLRRLLLLPPSLPNLRLHPPHRPPRPRTDLRPAPLRQVHHPCRRRLRRHQHPCLHRARD